MKTKYLLLVAGVLGSLFFHCLTAHAQPLQPEVLFSFPSGPQNPYGNLVQGSDGDFYGTTYSGGTNGLGTVFRMTTNGTMTPLVSFGNTNGANPYAGLVMGSDGNFYGTTYGGGTSNFGTVFRVTSKGKLITLVSFNNTNGANPYAALALGNDGTFYGTTYRGGMSDLGTVFHLTTEGALTTLVSFSGTSGAHPVGGLTLGSDGNFYGTTEAGGSGGDGAVFKVTPSGTLTTLASFGYTNGAYPHASLTLGSDGNFYGTTPSYGSKGYGTVFQVTTNGTLTTLVSFAYTNGANPQAALTLGNDGIFYGTTVSGGRVDSGNGTVFRVTTNGTLTTLSSFGIVTNSDWGGAHPYAGLTLGSDGKFYGATVDGGRSGVGAIFQITSNGILTTLHSVSSYPDGQIPYAGLTLGSDGKLYGTTSGGGSIGSGTVFQITTNGALTTLVSFDITNGVLPRAALTLGSDGDFYGTTYGGGSNGYGTVFRVTTNGTLASLVAFNGTNGAFPETALTLGSDGNFYGTTFILGASFYNSYGTVFRVTTNGTLSTLHSFNAKFTGSTYTNADGFYPNGLTLGNDGSFYGTTFGGASRDGGTVFQVTTNGTLTTLYSFGTVVSSGGIPLDGVNPYARLTLGKDGSFYGTTRFGGSGVSGTVFQVMTNGRLTTLYAFSSVAGSSLGTYTNADGALPGGLTLGSDGNFYGMTEVGGSNGYGTVFQVATNGRLTTLVQFTGPNGSGPFGTLALGPDGNFYGTAQLGGPNGNGEIFRLRRGAYVQSFGTVTNGFQLNFLNVGGSGTVVLESSPDLRVWTPIRTNGPAAARQFLDTNAFKYPMRFYRFSTP